MQKEQDRGKIALFVVVAALVLALDQLSKSWVRNNAKMEVGWIIELLPEFLDFVYVKNYGSAFGLLANQTFLLISITITSLVIILLFLRHLYRTTTLSFVSTGLILAGALGNLIDRLRFGYVTDFIDVHLGNLFHWYTFNIADTAIVIGILTFIYSLYRSGLFSKVYEHRHSTP